MASRSSSLIGSPLQRHQRLGADLARAVGEADAGRQVEAAAAGAGRGRPRAGAVGEARVVALEHRLLADRIEERAAVHAALLEPGHHLLLAEPEAVVDEDG